MVEDLHWLDPSTLELLGLLIDQVPTANLLLLTAARPSFQPPWGARSQVNALRLGRLTRAEGSQLVMQMTGGKLLPAEVLDQIIKKTDGVPLFIEELTKTVLELGLLRDAGDRYELIGPLTPLAIPATVHDSLMARLDRLSTAKTVAQLGAVLGRSFAYDLLHAVAKTGRGGVALGPCSNLWRPRCCISTVCRRAQTTASSIRWCRMPPMAPCCAACASCSINGRPKCW